MVLVEAHEACNRPRRAVRECQPYLAGSVSELYHQVVRRRLSSLRAETTADELLATNQFALSRSAASAAGGRWHSTHIFLLGAFFDCNCDPDFLDRPKTRSAVHDCGPASREGLRIASVGLR